MDIKKIYENARIVKIENELVKMFEHRFGDWDDLTRAEKEKVDYLALSRKELLDKKFKLDENYKRVLSEFNEALKAYLIDMRLKAIDLYKSLRKSWPDPITEVNLDARCYLGQKYPALHPVQTDRAKKIWAILAEGIEDSCYRTGGVTFEFSYYTRYREDAVSHHDEQDFIYLKDNNYPEEAVGLDNWNEGLDREMTKDMSLIYAFHNLYEHCYFSIFDFLWVREFYSEFDVSVKTADGVDWDAMQNLFE